MKTRTLTLRSISLTAVLLPLPFIGALSDHADPIFLKRAEAGIAGLFAFTDGDDLALILTVRRRTNTPPPYELEGLEFTIHIDTHSPVDWMDTENNARYGGSIPNPEDISADATIRFRLENNVAFVDGYPALDGFITPNTRPTNVYSGVRDDPFIFPRFQTTNVVAMAVTIPYEAFRGEPQNFLLWATTTKEGWFGRRKQIDHVGRSARSQAGRFDFLNTIPPERHVEAINGRLDGMQARIMSVLSHVAMHVPGGGAPKDLYTYVLGIRKRYDIFPDVMIYSRDRGGYPNGRRPSDDIVGLTCSVGDCILQELAYLEAPEGVFPRVTVHTPPTSDTFPYLTPPIQGEAHAEPHSDRAFWIGLLIVLVLWIAWMRYRQAKAEKPWVRPRHT